MITHWDDLEASRRERGHIAATWKDLTGSGSRTIGVQRIEVEPGRWSTPYHIEGSSEEIFYVLGGSGTSLQDEGEGDVAFPVGPGDVLVHLADRHAHTLRAGDDGLDVLAFGERHLPWGSAYLPRAGVSWGLVTYARTGSPEDHPWKLEADAGPPELPDASPRGAWRWVVNESEVEISEWRGRTIGSDWKRLGEAAGSDRTGLRLVTVLPGVLAVPPHCHSAEEEIFVVLEGDGTLELWSDDGVEEVPVRVGHTVARPAGTRVAHTFRAGQDGLRYLAYGTRDTNDIAYYPRSDKVYLRGVGVVARLERVGYLDGED